jgi:S-DNA-T family DNA segregation ATPase FtsK/SpoIIIE
MKGETALVTIKDAFAKVREEMIDTDNHIPVVLGINEEGDVIWEDLKKINSMLVTGMPRSGKSWFVKSVLAQMAMFLPPEDLHFYLLDPKDDISDFKSMSMPHIRKFVSSDEDILKELRWVVEVEASRRQKIMKEAGNFINYWDLKKSRPNIELPLLYVVIDEVVTLADRMDKETKKEFQGLLSQLVSQLPALGIRIFMIPHVVKNHILKKTITDLIPCRISVRGDADHIESSVGTKASDFVHKLTNQGDMAVKLNNGKAQFVHGAVIGESNEKMENFFDFLTQFWLKVNPDYIKGSKYEKENKTNSNFNQKDNEMKKDKNNKAETDNQYNFNDIDVDEEIELFEGDDYTDEEEGINQKDLEKSHNDFLMWKDS